MAELEILSPLHVGNGKVLGLIDFVLKANKFVKIRFDKLAEYCYENNINLAGGIEDGKFKVRYGKKRFFSVEKFLEYYRMDHSLFAEYEIPANIEERKRETKIEVREFIKNVEKKPYLPGSSIKGGIRTALLWKVLKKDIFNKYCDVLMKNRSKRKNPCKNLEEKIFGKVHEDIFRVLRVSDTMPLGLSNLNVSEIKIIGNPTAIPTYVECLKKGKTMFDLWIDEKLLEERFGENKLKEYFRVDKILKVCNEFSMAVVEKQLKYNNFTNDTKKFFVELKNRIKECKENEAILNTGWGGGWYSKTIGLEIETYKEWDRLRIKLNLGKNLRTKRFVINFPKTRRVTIDGVPLGWVKVRV